MSDSSRPSNPLLNPVLLLRKEPVSAEAPSGGKSEGDIVTARLDRQRRKLADDVGEIIENSDR